MKKTVKNILYAVLAAVLIGCMTAAYIAGKQSRKPIVCKGIRIEILDSTENCFVTVPDVRKFLDRGYGKVVGLPVDSIDLVKVEQIIDSRSAVLKSEAFVTRDSLLNITITQRKPVVRFQKKDGGFYADKDGYIFPLQSSFASHVQIIDGHIPLAANSGYKGELTDPVEKAWIEKIMGLVNYIEASDEWRNMIVQIHVTENTDLILIPREGRERFVFGQPEDIAEKFERMKKYYTAVIPEKGSDKYKEVDLRFKGQIICR